MRRAARVEVRVRNPEDPCRSWTGDFLVDTGALESLVPKAALAGIGMAPLRHHTFALADGSEARFGLAPAVLEFMGEVVWLRVAFGEDEADPLLGRMALDSGPAGGGSGPPDPPARCGGGDCRRLQWEQRALT